MPIKTYMDRSLKLRKIIFLAFLAGFCFEGLSQKQSKFFKNSLSPVIDKYYLQKQATTFYLKSEMAAYNQDITKAIDDLKKALFYEPQSLHLHKKLAELYKKANLWAEATWQYEFLLEKKFDIEVAETLAAIYSSKNLIREAIKMQDLLLKSPNLNPEQKFSYLFQKSLLLTEKGLWSEALKSLTQADLLAPSKTHHGESLLAQAYIYKHLNQNSKKQKKLKALSKLSIDSEDLIIKISKFYTLSGQKEKALALLTRFQKQNKNSIVIANILFKIYWQDGKQEQARKQAQYLQSMGALNSKHYLFLISYFLEQKQYTKAIPFIKDLYHTNASKDYYIYLLASTYQADTNWDLALREYQKIPEQSSYFLTAQLQMAQLFKEKGNQKQAINILTKTSRAFPNSSDLYFLRGLYFQQAGKNNQALKDMKKVLLLDDSHAEALNFIAYIYAEQNYNLEEASQMAQKALNLEPHSSYFLDTIGWVYFRKKNYQQALTYLHQSLDYNKKDIQTLKHLGEVYYQLKNVKKYEYFFKQAIELEKDVYKKTKMEKKLAALSAS